MGIFGFGKNKAQAEAAREAQREAAREAAQQEIARRAMIAAQRRDGFGEDLLTDNYNPRNNSAGSGDYHSIAIGEVRARQNKR